MGLSYGPEYTYTDHFAKRALERFGVSKEALGKWVRQQTGSLTSYTKDSHIDAKREKYISESGIIFVCNTVDHVFVTCYKALDLLDDGKTIHERNYELFTNELQKLARKYRLKDTKELLLSVEEHVTSFYQLSQKLMGTRLSDTHYPLVAQLIDEYHVLKAIMRIIERQGDFQDE
ncbi:hypothetical protein [Streptococcus sp. zg-JUN1979]|uniref:hypothetical protein n=1 Tax=Streptococcus sp. zg-JUN1979 TaxID=3391450 RepID=UPI0039A550B0